MNSQQGAYIAQALNPCPAAALNPKHCKPAPCGKRKKPAKLPMENRISKSLLLLKIQLMWTAAPALGAVRARVLDEHRLVLGSWARPTRGEWASARTGHCRAELQTEGWSRLGSARAHTCFDRWRHQRLRAAPENYELGPSARNRHGRAPKIRRELDQNNTIHPQTLHRQSPQSR